MDLDARHLLTFDGLHLDHVAFDRLSGTFVAELHGTALHPPCPRCGTPSCRTRSAYTRTLADLPWGDRRVVWRLRVRRCCCPRSACPQRIFAERFPALAAPFARRTSRLTDLLRAVALALGGRGGARLAEKCALVVGRKALLALVRNAPTTAHAAPRVLGIDDWAYRRGQTYGTILVDHETGRVVDLLPDRTPGAVAGWLRDHPGVEVVTRDRAVVYADGVRQGAPDAVQVADRWHLLKNLGEAVLRGLLAHSGEVKATLAEPEVALHPEASAPPVGVEPPALPAPKQGQFDRIHALRAEGRTFCSIAAELDLSRNTVKKYARLERCPEAQPRPRRSALDEHKPYLVEQFNAGRRNARRLWEELQVEGFGGGASAVRHFLSPLRRPGAEHRSDDPYPGRPRVGPSPPSRRPRLATLAFAVIRAPEKRSDDERGWVERLRAAGGDVARILTLAERFAAMVRGRDPSRLGSWLKEALGSVAALRSFALGVWGDLGAVREGMRQPWSNGRVEGHVNRLKTVERQMYGRAKLDLLRARLLADGS